jgi:branched-subunit amino acid aminotransferase/4-amino-4-deoxychorismate lyase
MSLPEPLPAIVDGELSPDGRISVRVLGAALQHGEGLFETLPVLDGHPLFLDRHLARLRRGAEVLDFAPPPDDAIWERDLGRLIDATGMRDLAVRFLYLLDGGTNRRCVAATALPEESGRPARVGKVDPEFDLGRPLAGLKTLNYLVSRLAFRRGAARGLDEVLFTSGAGTILEGTRSSVFVVVGGEMRTAPLTDPVLPGVTREVILELAREDGIIAVESGFTWEELQGAEEAFLTSSLRGVRPLGAAEDRALPRPPGPVTRRLQTLYSRLLPRGTSLA